MNICFEAERTEKLDKFLENWENPTNPMTIAANSSFVEFKVHRIKDLVVISQRNFYDVVAKFLVFSGFFLMMITYLIGLYLHNNFYTSIWFSIGLGILFINALWLSPYYRYLLVYIRLRWIGYKGKLTYVGTSYALTKALYKEENGTE